LGDKLPRALVKLPGLQTLLAWSLTRPAASQITLEESQFLGELVRQAPRDRPIIEVGTLFGSSTRVLAMFKHPETPLISIENYSWNPLGLASAVHERITARLLADAIRSHSLRLLSVDKREFYAAYDGPPPGLVFLDANHSYSSTREDILWAQSVGASLICGHDHNSKWPGVLRAVEECGGAERVVGSVFLMRGGGSAAS
jgi:hypothetical protein